jgi:hypothetical protein
MLAVRTFTMQTHAPGTWTIAGIRRETRRPGLAIRGDP